MSPRIFGWCSPCGLPPHAATCNQSAPGQHRVRVPSFCHLAAKFTAGRSTGNLNVVWTSHTIASFSYHQRPLEGLSHCCDETKTNPIQQVSIAGCGFRVVFKWLLVSHRWRRFAASEWGTQHGGGLRSRIPPSGFALSRINMLSIEKFAILDSVLLMLSYIWCRDGFLSPVPYGRKAVGWL